MKTLLYIIGGLVCVALIIGAMYVAMSLGLSLYIVHANQVHMQQAAARQRQADEGQMQGSISWLGSVDPYQAEKQRDQDEVDGKLPSLFTDPEGYGTEDNWLASTISRELAGMAFFAAQPGTPLPDLKVSATVDPKAPSVHVVIDGWGAGPLTSDLTPAFAWDPDGYAPLAQQLIGTTAAVPEPDLAGHDVLANLLELTGPKLAAEDVRISANLQARPSSWQDHEAAALLLVALALRDEGHSFVDNRPLLCKATAHLALAQAWRGEAHPTWPGLIAGAAIRTLAGRELDALDHLGNLGAQADLPAAAKPWLSALTMRATQDWRKAEVTEHSPLLLKIVWFRILVEDLGANEAKDRLQAVVVPPAEDPNLPPDQQKTNPDTLLPDWSRIVGRSPYYGDANDDVKNSAYRFDLEFHELDEILTVEQAAPFDLNHLATVFAERTTDTIAPDARGKTVVRVIGAGGFKDASRGFALGSLASRDIAHDQDHTDSQQAPAQVLANFAKMETLFKDVPDYDFARLSLGMVELTPKVYTDMLAAKTAWPIWEVPQDFTVSMPGEGKVKAFYRNAVPFGTVYDAAARSDPINAMNPVIYPPYNTPELEQLKKLPVMEAMNALGAYNIKHGALMRAVEYKEPTPFERHLLVLDPDEYSLAQDHLPDDKLPSALSRFSDYNVFALDRIDHLDSKILSDADCEALLRKHVALNPSYGFSAGNAFRRRGLVDAAAEMDRKAFSSGMNAIVISNAVLPLVDYDFAHGNKDEAVKVAQFAGQVASEMGLSTLTYAMEKLGRLDEAEAAARQDSEMYNDPDWFAYFQLRHPDRYPEVYARELKNRFPDGLQHAKLGDFAASPLTGAQITNTSEQLEETKLEPGDVIVALDGYRVDSKPQYLFVRSLSLESKMDFVIWRKDKYLEVRAVVPTRRMMVDIHDFVTTKGGP